MSNNENNPSRNGGRPEDNPFIAFRRFADSQVSSLLNTVFTLPATIANHNNAHKAREACLFNKADKSQCDQLKQIEDELTGLRQEGRELYRVGDLQEVLKKSEELMRLDRHADDLRRNIIAQSSESGADEESRELMHRVANQKGQEWGWDWSWGFPKPFDDRESSQTTTDLHPSYDRGQDEIAEVWRRIEEGAKRTFGEQAWNDAKENAMDNFEAHPLLRSMLGQEGWEEFQRMLYGGDMDAVRQRQEALSQRRREIRSRAMKYHRGPNANFGERNYPYAPEALEFDEQLQDAGVNWREAFEDLLRIDKEAERKEWNKIMTAQQGKYPKHVPWTSDDTSDEPSYEYSHDHEDQHDDPPTPKVKQGKTTSWEWCAPAQTEDASDQRDIQKFLHEQHQQGRHLDMRLQRAEADECDPAKEQSASDKLDIQRFLREQQEQNGLQLGLRDQSESTETELDVYEQLLEKPKTAQPPSNIASAVSRDDLKPSILSTLTTTERSVASDGSVTTKVVLKKRFSDGREESSETVHTQRGHEMHPWHLDRPRAASQAEMKDEGQETGKKRSGWFWSS